MLSGLDKANLKQLGSLNKSLPYASRLVAIPQLYNNSLDLFDDPSFEHVYRVANTLVGTVGFLGGLASFMADTYERGIVWFANWIQHLEKQLQSKEFWEFQYGY
jgi:hypothetical protein